MCTLRSHCLESGVTFSIRAMKLSRNSVLLLDSSRSLQYSLKKRGRRLFRRKVNKQTTHAHATFTSRRTLPSWSDAVHVQHAARLA